MQVATDRCSSLPASDRVPFGAVQPPEASPGDAGETRFATPLSGSPHSSLAMRLLLSSVHLSVPRVQSVALLGLIAVLSVGLGPAQAQSSSSAVPGAVVDEAETAAQGRWKPHFDDQIAQTLRTTTSGAVRTTLLQTFIDVIVEEGEAVEGRAAVPALLRILENDPSPQRRLLAAQALDLVVPERTGDVLYRSAIVQINDLVEEESAAPVRRALASMLRTYRVDTPAS